MCFRSFGFLHCERAVTDLVRIPRDQDEVLPALQASSSPAVCDGPPGGAARERRGSARSCEARHRMAKRAPTHCSLPLKAIDSRPATKSSTRRYLLRTRPGNHNPVAHPCRRHRAGHVQIDPAAVEAAITPARAPLCRYTCTVRCRQERRWRSPEGEASRSSKDAAQAIGAAAPSTGMAPGGELGWCDWLFLLPSKTSCVGDGGMMVTSDDALAERSGSCACMGREDSTITNEVGTNSRLGLSAGCGAAREAAAPRRLVQQAARACQRLHEALKECQASGRRCRRRQRTDLPSVHATVERRDELQAH